MHKKITKTLLLITLLVLLLGITSAATVTDNTTTNKVVKDTNTAPHPEIQKSNEKVVENKIIKKENKAKNVKESSYTTSVSSYTSLVAEIEEAKNSHYDNYNINLEKGDYNSTTSLTWGGNVQTKSLTINGNGITIKGQNKHNFISVAGGYSLDLNNIILSNFYGENAVVISGDEASTKIETETYVKWEYVGTNITIKNSKILNNYAYQDENYGYESNGGIIGTSNSKLKIVNCTFENNTSGSNKYVKISTIKNTGDINDIINNNFINNTAVYGGAIKVNGNNNKIINNTFINNKAEQEGGSIYIGNDYNFGYNENTEINNNLFLNNKANNGGAIFIYGHTNTRFNEYYGSKKVKITNNTFNSNKCDVEGSAIRNEGEDIVISKNTFIKNLKYDKDDYGYCLPIYDLNNAIIKNNINDTSSTYHSTIYTNGINTSITNNIFNDGIKTVTITLQSVKGTIGENITLNALLTDENGTKITGGNLAFKLNGKTLRSDGRFDSKASAMKFSVKDGIVTHTIKADLYLRNAKNLTASYSGTNNYYESTSPSVTAQIQKRNAQVTVTSTPTRAKQYETLTFKITAKDITKNGKNNTLISDNTKVMLKVNGVTLKDANGKPVYVTLDKNAQATYKYTIPAGTGGITASKAQRNYKVDAIFVGDNYYPGARNTTTFQVERSTTAVTITQAKATKTNILSVKATLKDYKQNNLIGTNKVTIKINGKSYTKNGKPVYWSVKNGNVDLTGIQVDPKTTIKRVLLVTGERQAYTEGRAETTNIIKT